MRLVPLFTIHAWVEQPIDVGKTSIGQRLIYHASHGEFSGERLRGRVLPGGGEWFLQSDEGLGQIDVRLLLETDDGALVYMRYSGVMEYNEAVLAAIGEGRSTEFGDNRFLTHVRFECSHPDYAWLSRTIAVGEGRIHPDHVEYSIHEVVNG